MIKKLVFIISISLFLLTISNSAMAIGLGVYFNGGFNDTTLKNKYVWYPTLYSYYRTYESLSFSYGGGLTLDTCVADDKLFNYRLKIDFAQFTYPVDNNKFDYKYGLGSLPFKQESTLRISMKHVFGFRVFANSLVRIWLGPSISASYYPLNSFNKWENLLVPGVLLGININLNKLISLTTSCSFDYEWSIHSPEGYFNPSIFFNISIGVLFRINDSYNKSNIYIRDKSMPDKILE